MAARHRSRNRARGGLGLCEHEDDAIDIESTRGPTPPPSKPYWGKGMEDDGITVMLGLISTAPEPNGSGTTP
jgi:hypothetical protein